MGSDRELPAKHLLFLIGLKGAGKSTVAQALHGHPHCSIWDTDAAILSDHHGRGNAMHTISQIYAQGKSRFRQLERYALAQILTECADAHTTYQIIACGGGILDHYRTRALVRPYFFAAHGGPRYLTWSQIDFVYLYASSQVLYARIVNNMPAYLQKSNPQQVWDRISTRRQRLFRRYATITLNADELWGIRDDESQLLAMMHRQRKER